MSACSNQQLLDQLGVSGGLRGNLEKILFLALERDLAPVYKWEPLDGFRVYKLYLAKTVTPDTCFSNEFLSDENVMRSFYGPSKQSPKYFSLASSIDLKRLSSVCDKSFIILSTYVTKNKARLIKYFDYRIPEELFSYKRESDSWLELTGDSYDKKNSLYYMLQYESPPKACKDLKHYGVLHRIPSQRAFHYQPLHFENKFVNGPVWDVRRTFNGDLCRALQEVLFYFLTPQSTRRKAFNKDLELSSTANDSTGLLERSAVIGGELRRAFENPRDFWQKLVDGLLQSQDMELLKSYSDADYGSGLRPSFPSGLLLLAHIGPENGALKRRPMDLKRQLFTTLTVLGGGRLFFEWAKSWVIILSPGGKLYRPCSELEELLIGLHRERREGLSRPLATSLDSIRQLHQTLTREGSLKGLEGWRDSQEAKAGQARSFIETEALKARGCKGSESSDEELEEDEVDDEDEEMEEALGVAQSDPFSRIVADWFPPCGCRSCTDSIKFKNNMNSYGPSKLYASTLDLSEALEWVGWMTPTMKRVLSMCATLSCASVDIESTTHEINPETHRKRPLNVSSGYQGGPLSAVQKPVLWCHLDRVLEEEAEDRGRPTSEGDSTDNPAGYNDGGVDSQLREGLRVVGRELSAEGVKAFFLRSKECENDEQLWRAFLPQNTEPRESSAHDGPAADPNVRDYCGTLPRLFDSYLQYVRERQHGSLLLKYLLLAPFLHSNLAPVFREHCRFIVEWVREDKERALQLMTKPRKLIERLKAIDRHPHSSPIEKQQLKARLNDQWDDRKRDILRGMSHRDLQKLALKSASKSWQSTLFGQIEKQLYELCRTYFVFAFNGTRYDFPLLVGGLTVADDRRALKILPLQSPLAPDIDLSGVPVSTNVSSLNEKSAAASKKRPASSLPAAEATTKAPIKMSKRERKFHLDYLRDCREVLERQPKGSKNCPELEDDAVFDDRTASSSSYRMASPTRDPSSSSPRSLSDTDDGEVWPPLECVEKLTKALMEEGSAGTHRGCARLNIAKSGRGIAHFSLRNEYIFFRDAAKLISPGFSLSKLAKTCGLGEAKSVFPFELLTSVDYLLSESLPPVDDPGWESRLRGGQPPPLQDIREAKEVFHRLRMRNVGQFLKHYLRLDVILLQKSVLKLCRSFEKQLGFHPLQVRKTTVAALSTHGAQLFLFQRKKPGLTCVNHAPMYNLLKSSCRGGLTQVSRTEALPQPNCEEDEEDEECEAGNGAINAHWIEPENDFADWKRRSEEAFFARRNRTALNLFLHHPEARICSAPSPSEQRPLSPRDMDEDSGDSSDCQSSGRPDSGLASLSSASEEEEEEEEGEKVAEAATNATGPPYPTPPPVPLDYCRLPDPANFCPQSGDRLLYFDVASLYASAGLHRQAFGHGTLFVNDDPWAWRREERSLAAMEAAQPPTSAHGGEDGVGLQTATRHVSEGRLYVPKGVFGRGSNANERHENAFVQWLALEAYGGSKSRRVISNFHAGPGQRCLGLTGPQPLCRADAAVSIQPGHWVIAQYHGSFHHYIGHRPDCPLRRNDGEDSAEVGKEGCFMPSAKTEESDRFAEGYFRRLSQTFEDDRRFCIEFRTYWECDLFHGKDKSPIRGMEKRHGLDFLRGPKFGASTGVEEGKLIEMILKTEDPDHPNYVGGFVTISGGQETRPDVASASCGFVLQRGPVCPEELGTWTCERNGYYEEPLTVDGASTSSAAGPSIDEEEGFSPSAQFPQTGEELERRAVEAARQFQLRRQAERRNRLRRRRLFLKRCQQDITMVKRSLSVIDAYNPGDRLKPLETMSTTQFRWLVRHRGFTGFRLVHYIHFEERDFFRPWLAECLQRRHYVKLYGGDELLEKTDKIILNSFYGYAYLEPSNYTRSLLYSESSMKQRKTRMNMSGIVDVSLVGVKGSRTVDEIPCPEEEDEEEEREQEPASDDLQYDPDEASSSKVAKTTVPSPVSQESKAPNLLYLVTKRNERAGIQNAVQLSAGILSHSRVIFYSLVEFLLNTLDPSRAELCYIDTDSVVFWCRGGRNGDLNSLLTRADDESQRVSSGRENFFHSFKDRVFVDERSPRAQSGKLKLEGEFAGGLFKTTKSYILFPFDDAQRVQVPAQLRALSAGGSNQELNGRTNPKDDEDAFANAYRRLRSVPKSLQSRLSPGHFRQEDHPCNIVSNWRMGPTSGLNIAIGIQSKKLASAINLKRRSEDGIHTFPLD